MKKRGDIVTEGHIIKIWTAIIVLAVLTFVFPPAGLLLFLVLTYWMILFFFGLAKLLFEEAGRPSRPVQQTPKEAAKSAGWADEWKEKWLAVCESPAEVAFFEALVDHFYLAPHRGRLAGGGITVDLQKLISSMRVDFLVNERLVVEVDGAAYHSTPKAIRNDARRDERLGRLGYKVLRIPAKRVFQTPERAVQDVVDAIAWMAV